MGKLRFRLSSMFPVVENETRIQTLHEISTTFFKATEITVAT